jgi:hypothetical protein
MKEYTIFHMKRVEYEGRGVTMCAMNVIPVGLVRGETPEEALQLAKKKRPYLGCHISIGGARAVQTSTSR